VSATNEKYKAFLCFEMYADRTDTVCELSCDTESVPRVRLSNHFIRNKILATFEEKRDCLEYYKPA